MPESITEVKHYSVEDFLSTENLDRADATVTEIFKLMFDLDIKAIELSGPVLYAPELDERTAIVGFSGSMRGSCQIRIGSHAACSIASAMLGGVPIDEEDDSVNDALGELCNMLAGGWKNGIPGLSSQCAISPPTVISGFDYKVHVTKPSVKISRRYQFNDHVLLLTICREENGSSHS